MTIIHSSDERLRPGTNFCKCAECREYFGGVRAFDLHRLGPAISRKCADPASLVTRKGRVLLRLNEREFWVGEYLVQDAT